LSSNSKKFLDEGIQAAEAGNKDLARDLFWKALQANPDNEQAWLWRMSFARTKTELIDHGRQVLRIDPANAQVLGWLEKFCRKEGIAMPRPALDPPTDLHPLPPPIPAADSAKPQQVAGKPASPIAPVHTGEPMLPVSAVAGLKTGLQPRPVPVPRSDPKPSAPSPTPATPPATAPPTPAAAPPPGAP
jgi:hypothetical protein